MAAEEEKQPVKSQSKRQTTQAAKPSIPFIQAKEYLNLEGKEDRKPRVIVIHCMEAPESTKTAENVARYFSELSDGRIASAHYCVDSDSVVQCVQCRDVAYGAKGMNRHGIHIELAGYAAQNVSEWADEFSVRMLRKAANLCAKVLIPKYGIQARWLSPSEIIRVTEDENITGFVTHRMVTDALKIKGGHRDPGSAFPINGFLDMVRKELD